MYEFKRYVAIVERRGRLESCSMQLAHPDTTELEEVVECCLCGLEEKHKVSRGKVTHILKRLTHKPFEDVCKLNPEDTEKHLSLIYSRERDSKEWIYPLIGKFDE